MCAKQSEAKPGPLTAGSSQLAFEVDYPDEKTSHRRLRRAWHTANEAVSENQALLPLAGGVIGVLLALIVDWAAGPPDPDTWAITVAGARNGLISALSILFAGLSIVLALASSTIQEVVGRFSLRLLRIYLRNPWDKAVIAVFTMAATFNLVEWFQLRSLSADALAPVGGVVLGVILLLISGAMMIWYLSAVMSWLRLDRTLRRVARLILNAARTVERQHRDDSPAAEASFERPPEAMALPAPRSGYLTDVDTAGLFDLAMRYDVEFVIDRGAGLSVVHGEPIGWIAAGQSVADELPPPDRVADMIGISDVRELDRAIGYGLSVLVDIAIMALSPAVNDPNTGVQVIEEMIFLFPQLARIRLGPVGRTDAEGRQRVAVRAWTFGDYVKLATTQIVLYGSEDPAVVLALQHFVRVLERLDLSEDDRDVVDALASRVRGLTVQLPDVGLAAVPRP
ncbi:MAG: DUF2254 domain-containing protein [Anaerolineae bacterium]|nr:DUF2254 domain-containing protein [Anaerolineae bacterium]